MIAMNLKVAPILAAAMWLLTGSTAGAGEPNTYPVRVVVQAFAYSPASAHPRFSELSLGPLPDIKGQRDQFVPELSGEQYVNLRCGKLIASHLEQCNVIDRDPPNPQTEKVAVEFAERLKLQLGMKPAGLPTPVAVLLYLKFEADIASQSKRRPCLPPLCGPIIPSAPQLQNNESPK